MGDRTILKLPFRQKEKSNEANREANQSTKTEQAEDIILEYIRENSKITQKEIAIRTGLLQTTSK